MLVVGAFVGVAVVSFAVGRSTSSDEADTSPPIECPPEPLAMAGLPDGFAATGTGYFSQCEQNAVWRPNASGEPYPPIKMYGDPAGSKVIGWWYTDCGYPQGLVQPGDDRPACGPGGTEALAPAP